MSRAPSDSHLPPTVTAAGPETGIDTTLPPLTSYLPSRLLPVPLATFPTPFGRYVLQSVLGKGAMGVVYQAHDPLLERTVALKRIGLRKADHPDAAVMFRAEAQAAAQFDHRHIVTIHDVGEEAGELYFTMALVRGGTLAEARARLAGDARAAVGLMAKVAHAVAYAHAKRIIHRDLKPQNILLDEEGEPRVSDFGLAKILGASAWDDEGVRLGTPGYMSPEQARGETARVGPASDVWALGIILYELLTGRQPFRANDRETLTQLICTREPPPFADLVQGLPPELERIVGRCLEKDPANRYASAAELATDLGAWLAPAAPVEAEVKPKKRWRWAAAAAVVLAVGALSALGMWMTPTAEQREKARLVKQFEKGEKLTLVGETGGPGWYRFRTEVDRKPLSFPPPLQLRLLAERSLLVELFPVPIDTGFRFHAEVQQSDNFIGSVGIYFGHREVVQGPATGHWFWTIEFNEFGKNANQADLTAYFHRPTVVNGRRATATLYRVTKEFAAEEAAPWRRLSVEVTPTRIEVKLDKLSWSYPHAKLAELARPEMAAIELGAIPSPADGPPGEGWGSVGLFADRGEARYRNVTLEKINKP